MNISFNSLKNSVSSFVADSSIRMSALADNTHEKVTSGISMLVNKLPVSTENKEDLSEAGAVFVEGAIIGGLIEGGITAITNDENHTHNPLLAAASGALIYGTVFGAVTLASRKVSRAVTEKYGSIIEAKRAVAHDEAELTTDVESCPIKSSVVDSAEDYDTSVVLS